MPDSQGKSAVQQIGAVHSMPVRVYYADTDAGGVVYHANYLAFAERARAEMLRELCDGQVPLGQPGGYGFVVRHATMDFEVPARLDDHLVVESRVTAMGGASVTIEQRVRRDDRALVTMLLRMVCIDDQFRAVRIPPDLRRALWGAEEIGATADGA
jgi:acyl-CoA thioester hydrolase